MERILEIFNLLDVDANNRISITEFITASVDKQVFLTEDRLKKAFKMFDDDESGAVEIKQLKYMFGIDDKVWEQML